jgi:hypothetical protein
MKNPIPEPVIGIPVSSAAHSIEPATQYHISSLAKEPPASKQSIFCLSFSLSNLNEGVLIMKWSSCGRYSRYSV